MKTKKTIEDLGIEIVTVDKEDLIKYKVKNGVKITKLYDGKLKKFTDIKEGFLITSVNNKDIHSINDFIEAVENKKGGIMLQGKYAGDSTFYYYAFGM